MATVASLNVRIGGDIRELEKALKSAQRAVQSAGNQLSSWGNELSLKLTAPMRAFGAAAIKSAGEIEAMEKAMQATFAGAGRSMEAANEELVALRKAAEAPGLDFEQAVKASIRLQGVGFSAEKARNTIVQLANAISTTGGTAENLNGVTVQFAQMISKGKILTSDLNVIKENMPGLAKIMQETFGTTSADALREMGVSGQEFVERVTAAMEKLPRVQGGISNAIVNAGTAIKMFLASVGESLNKTFNISGKLEAFASWLDGLAKRFENMSDGTRNLVAGVAVFAVALGPMLKVGQGIIMIYGQAVTVFASLQKVLLQSLAGQAVPGAIAAFKALDAATKLTAIGAAIGVVLALAAAFVSLSGEMSTAEKVQRSIDQSNKDAVAGISSQKTQVDSLVNSLKDQNLTLEGRKVIINQLKQISPEYFGQLDAEKAGYYDAAASASKYVEELLRLSKIKAYSAKIDDLNSQLANLNQTADPTLFQTLGNAVMSFGSASAFAGNQIATSANNVKKQSADIQAQIDGLSEEIKKQTIAAANDTAAKNANVNANKKTGQSISELKDKVKELEASFEGAVIGSKEYYSLKSQLKTATEALEKATGKEKKSVDALAKSYRDLDAATRRDQRTKDVADYKKYRANATDFAPIPTMATPGSVDRETKPGAPKPTDVKQEKTFAQEKVEAAAKAVKNLQEVMDAFKAGTASFSEAWDAASVSLHLSIERLSLSFENLGKVMKVALFDATKAAMDYAEKGGASFKEMGKAALAGGAKVVRSYIMQGVAAAVSKALQSIPFPLNLVAGGAAGAAAGVLFNKLLGALKIPAMAKGGIVSGATMALVGEYPGARSNPEVIAPLDKLRGMLRSTGSDVNVSGTFRVQGPDLLLVLEKAQKGRGRVAGY